MRVKNVAALALITVSTLSALATAKTTRSETAFFQLVSSGICLEGTVDIVCPFVGYPSCTKVVIPFTGSPRVVQIYSARIYNPDTQQFDCVMPYSNMDPEVIAFVKKH